jgi:hypothetical protein
VPDVFNIDASEKFLQLYCTRLKSILEKFHHQIATVPAAVDGLPTDDDDDKASFARST